MTLTSTSPARNEAEQARAYPIYRATGDYHALGRQHGEQATAQIRAHLDYLYATLGLSRDALQHGARAFLPLFERYCPHLLPELHGLSEGAGITFEEALAVNLRGALGRKADEGCTSFVIAPAASAAGETLIGQTSDTLPIVLDLGYVLHLKPEEKPDILMWTFGGMLGYHGLNSAGVAQFANDLGDGGPAPRCGLPHYPLKRMLLECASMAEIVALFERTPLASNGNYVLCDGDGAILDIEATTDGPELIDDGGVGFLAHANHFCSSRHATQANHRLCLADSFPRQRRIDELIGARRGALSVNAMQAILRDHDNHPVAICRHARSADMSDGFELAGQTVAALVAEPARGRLHVTYGPPCENPFVTYSMDA